MEGNSVESILGTLSYLSPFPVQKQRFGVCFFQVILSAFLLFLISLQKCGNTQSFSKINLFLTKYTEF